MFTRNWVLLAGVTLGSLGCTTQPTQQTLTVPLEATRHNIGSIAQATLVGQGSRTAISFIVGRVPQNTAQPVHLYTYVYPGRCDRLGAEPRYAMNDIVLADRTGNARCCWRLSKWLDVPLEQLRGGTSSLVVRASPADGGYDLFCGEID